MTSRSLESLPVAPGRNYQQLFRVLPGFTPPQNVHSIPSNPKRALQMYVNGTSRSSNNTRVDGASDTNIQLPWITAYVLAAKHAAGRRQDLADIEAIEKAAKSH